MISLLLSLHLSTARYRTNYDELPLSSLTDEAPRDELVNDERYNLPEEDTANDETETRGDIDISELAKRDPHPCTESVTVIQCGNSLVSIHHCYVSSTTHCHSAIAAYGYRKCATEYSYLSYDQCEGTYATGCKCAA